jgi:hypothetical protein
MSEIDWPEITVENDKERQWGHPLPLRYYLFEDENRRAPHGTWQGEGWVVLDRQTDFAVTKPYKRKHDCVRGFFAGVRKGKIKLEWPSRNTKQ